MRATSKLFQFLVTIVLSLSCSGAELPSASPDTASLPIVFEQNLGQAPSNYLFLSHHSNVETLFAADAVDMLLPTKTHGTSQLRFRLLGSLPEPVVQGRAPLAAVSNYLIGTESSQWIRGVSNQSEVLYRGIYDGIDLVFHGNKSEIEHDFRISPGANPEHIRFTLEGSRRLALNRTGDLEIFTDNGLLTFQKPVAYQTGSNGRELVDASFVLDHGIVRFAVGRYDRGRELIIDPVFSFSTYLAGSSSDTIAAVTSDASGNVYAIGYTYSLDFPVVNGIQKSATGSPTVFVSKFDPTGKTLLYSTYIGGTSRNYGNAIQVDALGDIIIAGTSSSNDFPHAGSVPALTCSGNNDCFFVASLKPDGSAFNYAGLIGGIEGSDVQTGQSGSGVLALDSAGNAYLSSVTDDVNFQITSGTLASSVPGYPFNSTFVLKANTKGALVYSTIIPGTEPATSIPYTNVFMPAGIVVDANGQATIAGTAGPGLPSTSGVTQPTFPNNLNAGSPTAGFVLQLNNKASAINYATYVPGTDMIGGLAVDSLGNSYVTGETSEANLPVSANAFQKTITAGPNCTCNSGFIVKLNGTGTSILAATYLEGTPTPGNAGTSFTGIALDAQSTVYVGGGTGSQDFPLMDPFVSVQVYGSTTADMIIAGMSPDLSTLKFGTFLSSTDQLFPGSAFSALAVDKDNNLIVAGETSTTDFPTTPGSYEPVPPTQSRHGFIAKFDMAVPAPSVCLDSWNVNFGMVPVKTPSTQVVNLTNCGNAPLNINSLVSSAPTVSIRANCSSVAAGAVCPLNLVYTPIDSSFTGGSLTIQDNTVIAPQIVQFSGQGVAPQLTPSFEVVDFGRLLVNTRGAANYLFFENTGNDLLQISGAWVNGDFMITQNECLGTVPQYSFCYLSIRFAPTAAGIRTGTLTIASNDPVHPRAEISLRGMGDSSLVIPVITSLYPPTAQSGKGAVTIQLSGANFYPTSVVVANGVPQATTYTNDGQLQATLDAKVTAGMGEIQIRVFNPAPGGGNSVPVPLTLYQELPVGAAFLAAVPGSEYLYASIPSYSTTNPNTVVQINPKTGALGKPIPVGNNPGLMAASSDGKYLFVVANQDQTVQRINLTTHTVEKTYPFPPDACSGCGPQTATDLKGVPGLPKQVVLSVNGYAGTFGEMALYDDGGIVNYVPTSSQGLVSFSSFAYAGSPLAIYALPFTSNQSSYFAVVNISPTGLQYTPPTANYGTNTTPGAAVVSDGKLLYTGAGEVWDPATQAQVGTFPVTTYNPSTWPNNLLLDSPTRHLYTLGDQTWNTSSSAVVLQAYSTTTLNVTGALAFPQFNSVFFEGLVRWGSQGFAFAGADPVSQAQVVFLTTSSIASAITSSTTPHVFSLTPASASQGSNDLQITVDGQGFTEASVVQWNGTALPTIYVAGSVLTAVVPAADFLSSGTALVTVSKPGGVSVPQHFIVEALAPAVSFSTQVVSFPAEPVGKGTTKTISLQNVGSATLNIAGIGITGTNATSFRQTNTCGTAVASGASCFISIAFKPVSPGAATAFLSVTDNSSGSPHRVTLLGTGN